MDSDSWIVPWDIHGHMPFASLFSSYYFPMSVATSNSPFIILPLGCYVTHKVSHTQVISISSFCEDLHLGVFPYFFVEWVVPSWIQEGIYGDFEYLYYKLRATSTFWQRILQRCRPPTNVAFCSALSAPAVAPIYARDHHYRRLVLPSRTATFLRGRVCTI